MNLNLKPVFGSIAILILVSLGLSSCKKEEQPENPPYSSPNNNIQYSWAGQKFVIFQYDSVINDSTQFQVATNDTMKFISQNYVVCRDSTAYYAVYETHAGARWFMIESPFPFGRSAGSIPLPQVYINVGDTFSFACGVTQVNYWVHTRRVQ